MTSIKNRAVSFLRLRRATRRISSAVKKGIIDIPFGPSSINLMMIDACNAQCIMCGKDYQSCGTLDRLSLQDMKTIYSHLDMRQVVDVIYGGGGEPFLNPDLARIAALTQQHYPSVQHTVISNFLQWKEEMVTSMLQHSVHFLISVNAATRETYRTISGIDGFTAVTDHVRHLVRLREQIGNRVHIALSMILMAQNIDELSDFIRLAAELGADEVKTLYVRVYPDEYRTKNNRSDTIVPTDSLFYAQEKSDAKIGEAAQIARANKILFEHEPFFASSKRGERNCCEPWKSLFINFNGDVYPCPASEILFKPKVDNGEYRSGNIIQQPIENFWNNEFWCALRRTNVLKNREELIPECRCCGNAINWLGSREEKAHVLNWSKVSTGGGAEK